VIRQDLLAVVARTIPSFSNVNLLSLTLDPGSLANWFFFFSHYKIWLSEEVLL